MFFVACALSGLTSMALLTTYSAASRHYTVHTTTEASEHHHPQGSQSSPLEGCMVLAAAVTRTILSCTSEPTNKKNNNNNNNNSKINNNSRKRDPKEASTTTTTTTTTSAWKPPGWSFPTYPDTTERDVVWGGRNWKKEEEEEEKKEEEEEESGKTRSSTSSSSVSPFSFSSTPISSSVSPSWPLASFYVNQSTEWNYKLPPGVDASRSLNESRYASIRHALDYSYHAVYIPERQAFQDDLVESILKETAVPSAVCPQTTNDEAESHWIVFTAGVMGAGKTYTLEWLRQHDLFPLHEFVRVDPDQIRRRLPEFSRYLELNPWTAGEYTRKEAGLLTELVTTAALQHQRNVVVDGTLRDSQWYTRYFTQLRQQHKRLHTAILHITAPSQTVLARARNRGKITGRLVPEPLLQQVMTQVPASIQILKDQVHVFVELFNGGKDLEIVSPPNMSWAEFARLWNCSVIVQDDNLQSTPPLH